MPLHVAAAPARAVAAVRPPVPCPGGHARRAVLAALCAATAALGASAPGGAQEMAFEAMPGVGHGGFSRGVAWGDVDGDGFPEVYVANADGQANLFYRNLGGRLVRDTATVLVRNRRSSEGVAWIDLDDDGDLDLFVANAESDPDAVFRNDGLAGFTALDDHPLTRDAYSSVGSCWADFDRDGLLDVVVVRRDGHRHAFFRGAGRGDYEPAAVPGLPNGPAEGRACVAADLDGDSFVDLALVHAREPNLVLRNLGAGGFQPVDGPFSADRRYSYGVSAADYDEDGDLDLFVADIDGANQLFRNDGDFVFVRVPDHVLVGDSAGATKGHAWGDLDLDGHLDLYAANGTPEPDMYNWLYRGLGDGAYARIDGGPATAAADTSAGVALADLDGDGRLDLFVAAWGGGDQDNVLYRNTGPVDRSWIAVELRQGGPNTGALGARLVLDVTDGSRSRRLRRWVVSSTGYGSQNAAPLHFGLPPESWVEGAVVYWPDGTTQRVRHLFRGRAWTVRKGGPAAPEAPQAPLDFGTDRRDRPSRFAGRIAVRDGRRLYLECAGTGSPTVILEAGYAAAAASWDPIWSRLTARTRVCRYDRTGLGRSDPAPAGSLGTALDLAGDLEALIDRAGVVGPYVLVGHSAGALVARAYAARHPDRTAGVVLVDGLHPAYRSRVLALASPADSAAAEEWLEYVEDQRDRQTLAATGQDTLVVEMETVGDLGDTPLTVLSAGDPPGPPPSAFASEMAPRMARVWRELQQELTRLSSRSRRVVVDGAGHRIHHDRPEAVIRAILEMVQRR